MKLRLMCQMVMQAAGLLYASVRYEGRMPNIENHPRGVVYSLPFSGRWAVINGGVTEATSHSWEIYPQRYAYDFLILDDEGNSFSGDEKALPSYYCYGKDLLAPADGVVVAVKDGFPDCRIMDDGGTDPATPDIGGNRVIIRHAPREYSALCHLQCGSVVVHKGQVVQRGDAVGRCGNSGNTTQPHLHFQLQNAKGFYSSGGVPARFGGIKMTDIPNCDTHLHYTGAEETARKSGYLCRGVNVENLYGRPMGLRPGNLYKKWLIKRL